MSARKSLLFVVIGALLGAVLVVDPTPPAVSPDPEEISNYRLMDSGPPVKS
ncbi:hypothetical protein ACFO1B_32710 [Dactylosporangium siamense]|uniref:Uncharacterized protein n=1 Tax=Dactylosporangium siamense TaxID=685454 RepID=A0A919PLA3_9ACTN|nr:hypothetical protein [Dactylosporangium siamense]GIG46207.1 hypothetical protein Dsi01nite_042480 [Dactylosporangium siamense]